MPVQRSADKLNSSSGEVTPRHNAASETVIEVSDAQKSGGEQRDLVRPYSFSQYVSNALMRPEKPARSTDRFLYPGAFYSGVQTCGRNRYTVEVTVKDVNLDQGRLSGYLFIENLTENHPQITTFFDGEIIGEHNTFLTGRWNTSEVIDRQHWEKFSEFEQKLGTNSTLNNTFDSSKDKVIFMRWKEHFLIPNHKCDSIEGASFAGFYYICFNLTQGKILGYYYHVNSEWFQLLELSHQGGYEGSSESFEFR